MFESQHDSFYSFIFFYLHDKRKCLFKFLSIRILYLDLIEAKTTGCFDLLDEESKLPTPRPEHFTTEVHNRNKGHPRLDVKNEKKIFFLFYQ
jgi:hypothetical protein